MNTSIGSSPRYLLLTSLAALSSLSAHPQSQVQKTAVHFQRYAGQSLDRQLAAALADHAAGSTPLLLIQDTSGTFAAEAKLPANDDLLFNASVAFASGAHVVASGRNKISCAPAALLTSSVSGAYLIRADGDDIDVGNCKASGAGAAAAVVGTSTPRHAKRLRVHDLVVNDIGVADLAGVDDATVWNFDATSTRRGSTLYGVVIRGDATHVNVHDGKVKLFAHGVEWFNADADFNKGGPRSRAQVSAHGGWYTIENMQCDSMVGACVWGSVAHDVLSRNNQSRNAGDVGFDCEGCIDYRSENDSSVEAANAGFATFFYSSNNVFASPHHTSVTGKNGMLVFNASRDPGMNTGTSVMNGVFNCNNVACVGVGGNASQGMQVSGSQFLNASIAPNDFWASPTIKNNHFVASAKMGPAINLTSLLGGGIVTVESNTFEGAFQQQPGTPCVALKNLDYNAPVSVVLRQNRCLGGFTSDWDATSGSGNGGVGMNLKLDRNVETHSGLSSHGFGGRDHITR